MTEDNVTFKCIYRFVVILPMNDMYIHCSLQVSDLRFQYFKTLLVLTYIVVSIS